MDVFIEKDRKMIKSNKLMERGKKQICRDNIWQPRIIEFGATQKLCPKNKLAYKSLLVKYIA